MKKTGIQINSIDIDGRCEPIGIDGRASVFHYTFSCDRNAAAVTAVQLRVSGEDGAVWDSGKQPFSGWPYTPYGGEPLSPMTRYRVQARAWDERNRAGEWSEPVWFETALQPAGFAADWIEPEQENALPEPDIPHYMVFKPNPEHSENHGRCRPAINIVRDFTIGQKVEWARVYMSAHGIYELYVNGQKAGKASFAPEISSYQTCLYYQTYDITSLLRRGNNRLAIVLADGWWAGRIGLIGASCQYGDRLGVIVQMEARLSDGTYLRICGDEDFFSHPSGTLCADLFMGEIRDERVEPEGWKLPETELTGWDRCRRVEYTKENLIPQPLDPVTGCEIYPPQAWLTTSRGECVVDFGRVLSGTVELTVEGEQGQRIELDYCEVLDREGNYFRNIIGRNKDQKDTLICRKGVQTWRPTFTYHGFRYVRIRGIEKARIVDLRAVMLASELRESGSFSCSHEGLNQLQRNIVQSERGNLLSIPTDCPQREKTAWTGDIQVFARTGAFNLDLRNFLSVWLMNLRMEQKPNGAVPLIAPNFPAQEKMLLQITGGEVTSAGWSDACVLLPWYLYQCYGQIELLQDNFKCMTDYLAYMKTRAEQLPDGYEAMTQEQRARNPYLLNKGYHYGDWLIPSLLKQPNGIAAGREATRAVVGSCWYAIVLETYLSVCRALRERSGWELTQRIRETEERLRQVRQAICGEYVRPDGTLDGVQVQGVYVMVLRAGAVTGELKKKTAARLAELIRQNGDRLDTGFSSVSFLLDVLAENGYRELAYRVLFQRGSPSWLYMVEHGATTVWENWEAVAADGTPSVSSYNHYAYGCVGDWIYRHIGGLWPQEAGYRRIVFAPDPECGLTWARVRHMTPFGVAGCEWSRNGTDCCVTVEIPVGAEGELRYSGRVVPLSSGKYSIDISLSDGGERTMERAAKSLL